MSKITIYSPPATAQIKACAVDFDLRRAPVPVHLVQYDKTIPILAVSLYKGSSPYTLPADAEVNVRMNKRNNLCVYNPALGCNESRDVVYVAVTPQMTTQDGTFEPILEVVINSGVAGTSPMQLVIRRNPVQEDAIEDTSEAKTLTELVSQAAASATAAAQSAGAAAEDAGKAAASATAAAESDEHAAATAQNIKDSLNQIAENKAGVSQLKEDTAKLKDGKISKFYASSQGNTNLPDSDDGRIMDLKLYGKSEQKQYSGKNLLKTINWETQTVSGVTIEKTSDTVFKISGTATGDVEFNSSWGQNIEVPAQSYLLCKILHGSCPARSQVIFFTASYDAIASEIGGLSPMRKTAMTCGLVRFAIKKGSDINCTVGLSIQMDSSTSYEPYVGGIPSPNPEYPQEIKSVVKPSVKVCGKNLLNLPDKSSTDPPINYEINKGIVTFSGTLTSGYSNIVLSEYTIPANGEYTISTNSSTPGKDSPRLIFSVNGAAYESAMPSMSKTFRAGDNVLVVARISDVGNYDGVKIAPMIEKSSTATDYQPYTEQTATLPYTLNAIPVTSGGNVTIDGQQYIADYVDVERGKLVRCVERKRLFDLNVQRWGELTETRADYQVNIEKYDTDPYTGRSIPCIISNLSKIGDYPSFNYSTTPNSGWAGYSKLAIYVSKDYDTVSKLKSYLGEDTEVVYKLKDSTETDLTADEIAAFKALVSHYPVTNVSTTSDQLDGYTVFNYPISLAKGYDYLKTQLGDTRDYLYGIDLMTAEAYVNSEYAAALAEIEV